MIIDAFCHIYPRKYRDELVKFNLQGWILDFDLSYDSVFVNPEARLKDMDKFGIDVQAISLDFPTVDFFGPKEAVRLARIANVEIAEISNKYPERFVGIGALPMSDPPAALEELDRAVGLGLKGVQIYSNVAGRPLDSDEFMPFFERICKHDIPILLHPTDTRSQYDWINEFSLGKLFGWPFDTSLALARLVYRKVLERFPELKIIVHHMGAMIPYFAQRIYSYSYKPYDNHEKATEASEYAIRQFKKFYVDTVLNGWKPAVMCAYAFFGANHIVFATDHPFGPEYGKAYVRNTLEAVKTLEIPEQEKNLIFEKNAKALLRI